METPVTLRYPNGRSHDATLNRALLPGERFELYGRTWTAVRTKQPHWQPDAVHRIVCVPADTVPPE
jgi:hypothetical protein